MYRAAIDIGNSSLKVAIYKDDEFILMQTFSEWDEKEFTNMAKGYFVKQVIVSDVRYKDPKPYMPFLTAKYDCVFTNTETKLPIKNVYASPNTLGFDRLAQCVAARKYYPSGNLLVISCGSCITYNFLNAADEFMGGGISPGLNMRFRALNEFTGNLPLVELKDSYDVFELVGRNTEESIVSGVIHGLRAEIDGIIESYKDNYDNLTCLITGGDWSFFAYSLKNKIFAHPNLVLFGLNSILQYNVTEKK